MADLAAIQQAFSDGDYIFTAHASDRAASRAIRSVDITQAVSCAEVIEDYPNDKYGPSCLLLGYTNAQRVLHIQVSYSSQVKIITVYEPSAEEWEAGFKTRKSK